MIQDGSTLLKIAKLFGCFIPAVNKTANDGPCDFTWRSLASQRHAVSATSFVPRKRARPSVRQLSRNARMSISTVCRFLTPNFTQKSEKTREQYRQKIPYGPKYSTVFTVTVFTFAPLFNYRARNNSKFTRTSYSSTCTYQFNYTALIQSDL